MARLRTRLQIGRSISYLAVAALLLPDLVLAGSLSGPVSNVSAEVVVEDYLEMPATAGSRPLARLNVLREAPDASGRLFVNDMNGPLYAIDGLTIHTYMDFSALFVNLKTSPGLASGFVSFEFHPEFTTNGLFYTVHSEYIASTPPNLGPALPATVIQHSILTEWTATSPSSNSFSGTSRELMRIAATNQFHNLGEIAFNPYADPMDADYGLLYITAGDFGSVSLGSANQLQRLDTPYGTVMRIDPLGGPFTRGSTSYDYGIPTGNPFADDPDPDVLGEIYAYGYRNPHRLAWEAGAPSEPPFVSDIGESNIEEVNPLHPGQNYGWPEREGTFALDVDVDPSTVFALPLDDASYGYTYPMAQYDHAEGNAIAGGFVYTGVPTSVLSGHFIFGDIQTGRLFHAEASAMRSADDGDPSTTTPLNEINVLYDGLPDTLSNIVATQLGRESINRVDLRFGEDSSGQLYVTTKQDGMLRKLTPVPEPSQPLLLFVGVVLLRRLRRVRQGPPGLEAGSVPLA